MISFEGRHFKKTIILMTVHWYLAYALSYRNIEELMAERGLGVDQSMINCWVIKYAPKLEVEFSKEHKRKIGSSGRMDETYIKVKRKWCYLYCAVDKLGATIDLILSKNRDELAEKRFFNKAIVYSGKPEKITINKSCDNNAALKSINKKYVEPDKIEFRKIKYLNNIVDQDNRFIKRITKLIMGFKESHSAHATLMSIDLYHMLHKSQHGDAANMPGFEQFYALAA